MTYQLDPRAPLADDIRRVLDEQAEHGVVVLLDHAQRDEEAIHVARVAIKRIRAVLFLLRKGIGRQNHDTEDRRWGDIAATMSAARDAEVVERALEEIAPALSHGPDITELRSLLSTHANFSHDADRLRPEVAVRMECASEGVAGLPIADVNFNSLGAGLRRAYASCRGFRSGQESPGAEVLHEWRKSTKLVVYHLRLFNAVLDRRLRRRLASLERVADMLGNDRDFALLDERLKAAGKSAGISSVAFAPTLHAVAERRRGLQHRAHALAVRALADSPDDHVGRLAARWRQAAALEVAMPPMPPPVPT